MVTNSPQILDKLREAVTAPKYSLVCENRDEGLFYYADKQKIIENLNDWEQLQINYPFKLNGFALDFDDADTFNYDELTPSWLTYNADNDKHHTVFLLDRPIELHNTALEYDAIKLYRKLKHYSGSDFAYNGALTKNPFNEKFRTKIIGGTISDLYKQLGFLNDYEIPTKQLKADSNLFNHYFTGESVNGQLFFKYANDYSHANKRLIFSDITKYFEVMDECIEPINRIIVDQHHLVPVTSDGAEQIITSITSHVGKYAHVWRERYTARQRYRASIKAEGIKATTRKEIERAFEYCSIHTIKPTKRKIAELAGIAERTISRTYKEEYSYHLDLFNSGFM